MEQGINKGSTNASKSKTLQKDVDFNDSRRKEQFEMMDIIKVVCAHI